MAIKLVSELGLHCHCHIITKHCTVLVWFPLSLSEPPGLSLRLEQREDVALPHGTLHVADDGRASPMYAFIKPPSMEVLGARLRGRETETEREEALKRRLDKAREELAYGEEPGNLDVATVNDTTLFTADNLQTRIVNTNWLTCSSLPDFPTLLGYLRCVSAFRQVGSSSPSRGRRHF